MVERFFISNILHLTGGLHQELEDKRTGEFQLRLRRSGCLGSRAARQTRTVVDQ